jgi:hypothetical protein
MIIEKRRAVSSLLNASDLRASLLNQPGNFFYSERIEPTKLTLVASPPVCETNMIFRNIDLLQLIVPEELDLCLNPRFVNYDLLALKRQKPEKYEPHSHCLGLINQSKKSM